MTRTELTNYINETKSYVLEIIVNTYGLDEIKANNLINKSLFIKLLDEDPMYVMHFNAEYWAEKIVKIFI